MLKYTITFVAVGAFLFALAPAAQAALYTENFVDPNGVDIALTLSNTGWQGSSAWGSPYVGPHVEHDATTDYSSDGDSYWVQNTSGQSSSKYAISKAGEYTITGPADLTCDWAANRNLGMRIMAEVGGAWYGSQQFGTGSDHGAMDADKVTDWEKDVSINTATDNWYQSLAGLPDGYEWRDGNQWSTTPLSGLPAGDVTRFGIGWLHTGNGHYGAVDNFRVTGTGGGPIIPEPSTLVIWALGLLALAWYGRRRQKVTNCITNRRSSKMFKHTIILVVVLAATVVLCCAVAAHANYGYEWIGDSTVNDEWANPSNWQEVGQTPGIKYPGELDEGYKAFENPYLPSPANPVVVSTILPHDIEGHCNIGHGAPYSTGGTMKVVAGGEISIGTVGGLWLGRNGRFATLIMEGGKFDTQRDDNGNYNNMQIAENGGNATNPVKGRIEMTGGEIVCRDLRIAHTWSDHPYDDALINLHGGQISANNLLFDAVSVQAVIDIQNDGLLVLNGDDTSTVAGLAAGSPTTGLIRGSNGVPRLDLEALGTVGSQGDLRWVYSSNDQKTYVWATGAAEQVIPEPSTLVIWALGLLALAWYARSRRK